MFHAGELSKFHEVVSQVHDVIVFLEDLAVLYVFLHWGPRATIDEIKAFRAWKKSKEKKGVPNP